MSKQNNTIVDINNSDLIPDDIKNQYYSDLEELKKERLISEKKFNDRVASLTEEEIEILKAVFC